MGGSSVASSRRLSAACRRRRPRDVELEQRHAARSARPASTRPPTRSRCRPRSKPRLNRYITIVSARCSGRRSLRTEHVRQLEQLKRADRADEDHEHQHRPNARERDVPELRPLARAVDLGRLVQLAVDRLQRGEEVDHPVADATATAPRCTTDGIASSGLASQFSSAADRTGRRTPIDLVDQPVPLGEQHAGR